MKFLRLIICFIFAFSLVCGRDIGLVQVKGSDTLINLVQKLAEVYMDSSGKYVAVTGGGSGAGIAALLNGKCDIADASRVMKAKEISRAIKSGIDLKRVVIAMDGLTIITNKDNPVQNLTLAQIGKVFRGDIKNWKELGGPNREIALYGRQSNSGTFVFFRDVCLKGDYSSEMNRMNGNAQIIEAILQDKSSIGYVGVGYVQGRSDINIIGVGFNADAFYNPLNKEDVKRGLYPLVRPLNQYINGDNLSPAIVNFIKFELSERGQKIVEEQGFFAIPDEYKKLNESIF